MDAAIPELDGYETAALIPGRERSRLTPIIFLTANNKADARVVQGVRGRRGQRAPDMRV